ncbi:MAG TPA: DUF1552 domain-containing protein [Planctomycetota bacterium]|jgi:hypothetical protein|nr:DUF1552 domain-containing protein [Planctomycetota bacterium]
MTTRRDFLRTLGVGAAAAPFLLHLPSLGYAKTSAAAKQRLIVMFSPNGVIPKTFWPDEEGETFTLKESLSPLEPFKAQTLILNGLCDKVKGDGDSHMRGIGCLLTGIELFPGNIQGGSHTPAGWAKGLSIDQEIRNFLQAKPETKTRFGSLEFGVNVPDRADTWTRMVYTGANKPVAPLSDPYQMLNRMYGQMKDQDALKSILDEVREDLDSVRTRLSAEDRRLLEEHAAFVRDMEQQLQSSKPGKTAAPAPQLAAGVRSDNENMPRLSKMQIDLMVNSFTNDFTRIATLQYTNSVGGAKMKWLGVDEGHHELSHKPDDDKAASDKLTKINKWYAEQMAYLAKRLAETPEPSGEGSLLDHTTIVWTNELGQGNSHTLNNIPFVLLGGGLGFKMGRSLKLKKESHNRLLLSLAHGFGHRLERFGNPELSAGGPLNLG